ncbi:MAG: YadA-like family protein [Phascolarctobacterium sp.]|nr:YadA-like family protein [Phascolarctobacterium sp.]
MKKNLAKKVTLSILAGAVLMSSSVVWAASVFVTQSEGGTDSFYLGFKESGSTAIQGDYNFAVGSGAKIESATKSVAIGTNAEINNASGSVALGYGSIASASNVVSVGSGKSADASTYQYRKIVNVADGEADHDAATVGQMERYVISAVAGKANATDVANTYATKDALSNGLATKANTTDVANTYATKDAVSSGLATKANATDVANTYATKDAVSSGLATKANAADVANTYATKDSLSSGLATKANTTDVANTYATKDALSNGLATKANAADVYSTTDADAKFADKAETKNKLDAKADKTALTDETTERIAADRVLQAQIDNLGNSDAISGINQRLEKTNAKINKVGAGAAALAALHPLDYDPDDKLTFSAGMGNYAGENAAALGAFYRPNEKFMLSLGGTMGNGENMVNLGLSIGLDKPNGLAKLSKRELIQKVNAVEAENDALEDRVAKLEALVAQLASK